MLLDDRYRHAGLLVVRFQRETGSALCRAAEGIEPGADGDIGGEPTATYPSLGLARTLAEAVTTRRTLDNDIAESLKQVVDKICILVDEVDETAKVRVVL